MSKAVYITGTDTGIGKTNVAVGVLHALRAAGSRATGMKPVASGCVDAGGAWRNADAEALLDASAQPQPAYATLNPYALPEPIAPHLAANNAGVEIKLGVLLAAYDRLLASHEHVVVEGVGGWSVPLSERLMQCDLVRALDISVLLVVGVRLGCINHALLSARTIEADGCRWAGWVANTIDPTLPQQDAVIATLAARLGKPVALVPYDADDATRSNALQPVLRLLR